MTVVTVNSQIYSDDGSETRDMLNGGHALWFFPMISDTMIRVGDAEDAATAAESSAAEALAAGFKYTFSTTTAMADPGAGTVRFNHGTIASVTALAFDATSADTGNPDVSDYIATWGSSTNVTKGYITFRKIGTPATFVIFAVTAAVTDNTGWLQVTVSYVTGNGIISNADVLAVGFDKSGDVGGSGDVTLNGAQTLTNKTIAYGSNTLTGVANSGANSNITSLAGLSTPLSVAQGGVGAGTFTDGGLLVGNGTGAVQSTTAGTVGQVLTSNGTGVDPTFEDAAVVGVGDHEVIVTTGNGFGSTSTKIRRFTTTQTNVGTAITYADSSTLGATFTINETGLYAIRHSEISDGTTNVHFGATLNSAQLTTNIETVTPATRLLWNIIAAGGSFISDSTVVKLTAGDVVRAHSTTTCGDASAATVFSIRKVGVV